MSIEIGSMVRLYRRTNPGVGVVVRKIEDVSFYCKNGMDDITLLVERWNDTESYSDRNHVINDFLRASGIDHDLGSNFLITNGFYKYTHEKSGKSLKNIKYSYVKIFWISNPSDYNIRVTLRKVEWYPTKWLREVKPPQTS